MCPTAATPQSPPNAIPRSGTGAPAFTVVAGVTLVKKERGTIRLIGSVGKPVCPGFTSAWGVAGIR